MKFNLWLFFVIFSITGFAQQNGSIIGSITDKEMNNEPLPFANIIIKGLNKGTTSDIDGNFELKDVDPGIYTLIFSYVGYETLEIPNVKVEKGKDTKINTSLGADNVALDEVVVETVVNRESENVLLLEQKKAVVAKQAIGAQELSRKGVSDAEGAVTKVSGISKQDGIKSVFVRGLGDRYNATTLNGFPIPSEEPEYKNISLDFFGTDIIQSVSVDKVFTSNSLSDVGGATIDISSKELSGNAAFQIDLSAGVNTQVMGTAFLKQKGVNFFGFSNRQMPSANTSVYDFSNSLDPSTQNFLFNGSIGVSGGKKWFIKDNPLSVFGVLSHSAGFSFTDEVIRNTTTNGTVFLDQNGKKYSQNINQLGLLNAKMILNSAHKLNYNFMMVHTNSQYVGTYEGMNAERYQDAYDSETGYMLRQQSNDNLLLVNQIMTDWKLNEKTNIEAGVSYNYLKGLEPDRRVNNFSKLSADSNQYKLTGSTGRQQRVFLTLMENDLNAKLAYVRKLSNNPDDNISKFSVGYNGRFVTDDFEAIEYDLSSQQRFNLVNNNFNLDNLYNQTTLDNGAFVLDRNFDNYDVVKQIHSAFGDVTYQVAPNLVLNGGLKAENVDLTVDYNVNRGGTKGNSKIAKTYILPNVNVKYDLGEKNSIRLGTSKTYTLPQSKEISPYIYVGVNFKSQGNPNLQPSDNYNVDLKWDYYISSSELLSLTTFYKHIVDPIARIEEGSSGGYLTYKNISNYATVAGVELELRKNIFSKEIDNENKKRLSIGWNASLTFTELEVDVLNTQKRKSQLEGASPFITNFDISYTVEKNNKSYNNSFVVNYFSDRIYTIGTLQYNDIIEKGVPTLDFISTSELTDRLTLKIKATNLLDPERKLTREASISGTDNVILNAYKKGIDFSIGFGYKF